MYSSFLAALLVGGAYADWTTQQWDAIIVGAGPAGIIVASRMAEAGLQTLLIEGGGLSYAVTGGDLDSRRPTWLNGTNLTRVDVPGLYKSIWSDPDTDLTCPSDWVSIADGCNVGGSSSINAGLFFEPPASDWDLYFPDGWKAADMGPAIERLYAKQPASSTTSMDGQLYLQSGYEAARTWLVDGLGYSEVDINANADDKTKVFGHPIFDYIKGQRGGPVRTYLQTALKLPNFSLQSSTRVLRVERSGSQATGVIVSINGVETLISTTSTGRVILSGGALQTPSLLMHSGIGPADTLAALQTAGKLCSSLAVNDWINSSAIGQGLFDNPNTFIELSSPNVTSYSYSYSSPIAADAELYLDDRSGPYAFAAQTSVFWDTTTRPDGTQIGFQGTIDTAGYSAYSSNNTITLNIYGTSGLLSTGSVLLSSPDFIPAPSDNIYYSDATDATYIATYIHTLFAGLPSSLTPLNIPATASIADIEAYLTTVSDYAGKQKTSHWSSSCRIGTCVDANLTVIGMDNLNVVDASVLMPLTVNPQFGTMAAAERGAELILKGMGLSIQN